jgi:hypothetical protein
MAEKASMPHQSSKSSGNRVAERMSANRWKAQPAQESASASTQSRPMVRKEENSRAIPFTILTKLTDIGIRSICRISYRNEMQGTAGLIVAQHKDRCYYLLVTCNHVVPFTAFYDLCQVELHFQELQTEMHNHFLKREYIKYAWTSSNHSYDATVIELTDIAKELFQTNGAKFLEVSNNVIKRDDQIGLVQYPKYKEYSAGELSFSYGEVYDFDDITLYYRTDGAKGSSGSPVLSYDGTVLAVHNSEILTGPMSRPDSAKRQTRGGTLLREILLKYFEDRDYTTLTFRYN